MPRKAVLFILIVYNHLKRSGELDQIVSDDGGTITTLEEATKQALHCYVEFIRIRF